jgi:nucleotide-binding universal stress UspA family protein
MKTIIIPTDFSSGASNAVNYAVALAKDTGSSILLFHAYQIPIAVTEVPVVMISDEEMRKSAQSGLNDLKAGIEHITAGSVTIYTEARLGDTIDELEALCNHIKPFAVVMGSKGLSSMEQALFGSTTLKAIRHITCPVITVPENKEYGDGIKKIGFACDFKEVVKTTPVSFIKEVVKQFNAELHILNVDHHHKHFKAETPEESLLLHTMLEDLNPVYDFIEHADIEDGINDFAEKNNLDLIIAIPKKHKLLEGLFRSSSSKQLIFQSKVPVMCVHE